MPHEFRKISKENTNLADIKPERCELPRVLLPRFRGIIRHKDQLLPLPTNRDVVSSES